MPGGKVCAICGMRPQELPGEINQMVLLNMLDDEIRRSVFQGYFTFQTSMDMGTDIWAAEIIIKLKSQFPEIMLICRLPSETQANDWPEIWRERYFNVLSMADDVICLQPRHTGQCYNLAMNMMISASSRLIAVYGGEPGRAQKTVGYARKKGLEIKIINPYNCARGRINYMSEKII